ncbi:MULTISPECIES: protein kinase [Microbacterium]|uniref:protein kinase domain-containing protein n=1 Tax=Microbacterium TaxID=33882 RepID=UPI0027842D99|nr:MULTISPECIES: protein kinase [Microbacterium]MDQ1082537.1 serine/threonine protein kinase [Microbacterium sp. SORGH_AS_0344]MDQ1168691.1 serine/threonine protein kinase [Microbacterium proteolyticum]
MTEPTLRDRSRAARRGAGRGASSIPVLGDVFAGRYRLLEPIGAHDRGRRVFRARDDILARDVAVAVFTVDAAQPRRLTGARTLAALDHPSLITLYDAQITADGKAYVVMDFIGGPSLRRLVEQTGPLAPDAAAAVVSDVARGLAAIHHLGIVHGRVASSNVLLRPRRDTTRPFAAVLTGFDITHLRGEDPHPARGRAYLTPEELRGEAVRSASDVYALGLLALEALTGEPPLRGGPIQDLVLAPLAYDPDIPDRFGTGWRALLTAMTDPDPGARPTAAEVVDLVAEVREGGGMPRRDPSSAGTISEPVPASRAVDLLRDTSARRRPAIWTWVTHYR